MGHLSNIARGISFVGGLYSHNEGPQTTRPRPSETVVEMGITSAGLGLRRTGAGMMKTCIWPSARKLNRWPGRMGNTITVSFMCVTVPRFHPTGNSNRLDRLRGSECKSGSPKGICESAGQNSLEPSWEQSLHAEICFSRSEHWLLIRWFKMALPASYEMDFTFWRINLFIGCQNCRLGYGAGGQFKTGGCHPLVSEAVVEGWVQLSEQQRRWRPCRCSAVRWLADVLGRLAKPN